ncbi:hypothetical protein CI109_102717 [Kwoniella shandongensis]|uniref:Copper transport protein n=1 Tax=Kwoniella shandongensis TaxID=1734106 RepID=A0A5M6BV81_9TREE|nr:uncharacterized protein CI109_004961 [Kwoniella shandongensis]KAA5526758.1 hypothetical protein CI109_004961 [Kwoniella shandongensis]
MNMHSSSSNMTACSVSMLWNWDVVDTCFLAEGWHITSRGMFAATCIGVALLGMVLEVTRMLAKDYDTLLRKQLSVIQLNPRRRSRRATPLQQVIRTVLYTVSFGISYLLMLLAMYYNGYIIISIFLGVGIGHFLCDWFTIPDTEEKEKDENDYVGVCCG